MLLILVGATIIDVVVRHPRRTDHGGSLWRAGTPQDSLRLNSSRWRRFCGRSMPKAASQSRSSSCTVSTFLPPPPSSLLPPSSSAMFCASLRELRHPWRQRLEQHKPESSGGSRPSQKCACKRRDEKKRKEGALRIEWELRRDESSER
eukprot:3939658-Rhodomonas_salina.2